MTHTLHRKGCRADLEEDFVILVLPAQGVNLDGSEEKMREIWEVFSHYESSLANYGDGHTGNSHTTSMEALLVSSSRISHAVFKDPETLKACLQEIKMRDFGISIVVSGLYDEISSVCSKIGLKPHTVEHSLGIHGRTDLLPNEDQLEIMTLCGHAMISSSLIEKLVQDINEGKTTNGKAAVELSSLCDCGVFNPHRAEKILSRMANKLQ